MIQFEWDPRKARLNLDKHGISFEEAQLAFYDPYGIPEDARMVEGEQRSQLLAEIPELLVVVVVYTVRRGDVILIISARRADRKERSRYAKTRA